MLVHFVISYVLLFYVHRIVLLISTSSRSYVDNALSLTLVYIIKSLKDKQSCRLSDCPHIGQLWLYCHQDSWIQASIPPLDSLKLLASHILVDPHKLHCFLLTPSSFRCLEQVWFLAWYAPAQLPFCCRDSCNDYDYLEHYHVLLLTNLWCS